MFNVCMFRYFFVQLSGSKFLHSVVGTNRGKPSKAPQFTRYSLTPKQLHSSGIDAAAVKERLPGATLAVTSSVVSASTTSPSHLHYKTVTIQQLPPASVAALGSTVTYRTPVFIGPTRPVTCRQKSALIHHGIMPGMGPRSRLPISTTVESAVARYHRQVQLKGGVISVTPMPASTTMVSSSVNPIHSSSVGSSAASIGVSADVNVVSSTVNVLPKFSSTTNLVSSSLTDLITPVTSSALSRSAMVCVPVPQKGDDPSMPIVIDDNEDDDSDESYHSVRHIEVVVTQASEPPNSTSAILPTGQDVARTGDNMIIVETSPDGITMALDQHGDYVIRMPPGEAAQVEDVPEKNDNVNVSVNVDVPAVSSADIVKSSNVKSVRANVDMDMDDDDVCDDSNVNDVNDSSNVDKNDVDDKHDDENVINDDVVNDVTSDRVGNVDEVINDDKINDVQDDVHVANADDHVHDNDDHDNDDMTVDNRIGDNVCVVSSYDAIEGQVVGDHLDQIIDDVAHGRNIQVHSSTSLDLDVTNLAPDVPDNLPVDVARDLHAIFNEMDEALAEHSHITLQVDPDANPEFYASQASNDGLVGDSSILDVEMSPIFRGVTVNIDDATGDMDFDVPDPLDDQQHEQKE